MKCPNCDSELSSNSQFCGNCGSTIKHRTNNTKIIIASILIAVLLIISTVTVVSVILKNNNNNKDNTNIKDTSDNLLMAIDDIFYIEEQGTTITGTVEKGKIKIDDEIQILGLGKNIITKVVEIKHFRENINNAKKGDAISIVLPENIKKEDILRGQVIIKPNTMKSYKRFKAKIEITDSKTYGGKEIIIDNPENISYYFRSNSSSGVIKYMENGNTLKKGDSIETEIILDTDFVMEKGTEFEVKYQGKYGVPYKVGKGIITEVYE